MIPNLHERVAQIFDSNHFNVIVDETPHLIVKIFSKTNSTCLDIHISENTFFVQSLMKCESGTGYELLQKLHDLAKILNISQIDLVDVSKRQICGIGIDLAILYVLTTGQSWYNHHGYISRQHQHDLKNNQSVILANFMKIMEIIHNAKKKDAQSDSSEEDSSDDDSSDDDSSDEDSSDEDLVKRRLTSKKNVTSLMQSQDLEYALLIRELNDVVPIDDQYTVQKYVKRILDSVKKKDCSKKNAILLNKLVNFISYAIKYNRVLSLTIPLSTHIGAGRIRKRKTTAMKCKTKKPINRRTKNKKLKKINEKFNPLSPSQ